MNDSSKPIDDDKSFLVRLKEERMTAEEFENEKKGINYKLIKDTRGRIFRLAPVVGKKLRNEQYNEEYNFIARLRERPDGDFDILGDIKLAEPTKDIEAENEKNAA